MGVWSIRIARRLTTRACSRNGLVVTKKVVLGTARSDLHFDHQGLDFRLLDFSGKPSPSRDPGRPGLLLVLPEALDPLFCYKAENVVLVLKELRAPVIKDARYLGGTAMNANMDWIWLPLICVPNAIF